MYYTENNVPLGDLEDAVTYVFESGIQVDLILEWLYESWDTNNLYVRVAEGFFQHVSQRDMVEDALENLMYWEPTDTLAGISYRDDEKIKRGRR